MTPDILTTIFSPFNLLMMNIGMAAGIIIGALPGLSAVIAITILLPVTFGLESIPGMYILLGAYCGAVFGGSITAILINTPGTPSLRLPPWMVTAWPKTAEPETPCAAR